MGPCLVRQAVNTLTAPHPLTSLNQNRGHTRSQCAALGLPLVSEGALGSLGPALPVSLLETRSLILVWNLPAFSPLPIQGSGALRHLP